MGFGKLLGGILAILCALLLLGGIAWGVSQELGRKGYEKEGTLVMESAYPAFVTNPRAGIYGEEEIQRSGRGL